MLAGFLLAYLEIFFRKHIPEAVSMIFVPLLSLLPTIIAAHVILGPVGWWLGDLISKVVNAGLSSSVSWLFSFLIGGLYAPLVITGLHHMTNAIDLQLISSFDTTNLWPMIALSNIAQGSAVLAVVFLHRGNEKEEQVSIPATISCYLGVTEPAMFGINLKYVYPFVAAMIGSAFAGMFNNLMNVRANSIGVGGLPGILSINGEIGAGWWGFAIAMLIAFVIPLVLTAVFRKYNIFNKIDRVEPELVTPEGVVMTGETTVEDPSVANEKTETVTTEELFAPTDGTLLPIEEVSDPVFSQKMMGDGYAVQPKNGHVYAPVSGTISSIFETKHAIGILTPGGAEVLVHMGLDTVELKGEPFTIKVDEDEKVTPETLLAEMDLEKVTQAGKKTDILTVFTNAEKVSDLKVEKSGEVSAKSRLGEVILKG